MPAVSKINAATDVEAVAQETILQVREMLDAEGASVLLLDKKSGKLEFAGISGGNESLASAQLAPGEGIAGWVARTGKSISIADVQEDDRFCQRLDEGFGYQTQTIVAAPLRMGDIVIGVIEGVNRKHQPFGPEDEQRLIDMARHVSIAFANAQVAAELRDRNVALEAEIQRRFRQIIDAKEEWLQTVDGISDIILMVEPDLRIRRGNMAAARAVGIAPTEVPGNRCHALVFGRATPCPECPIEKAFAGQPVREELAQEGKVVELSHFPIRPRSGGLPTTVVCSYRDVTKERALTMRLQANSRMASVGRLAGGMAHEINNPIGFVSSNLSSLAGLLEEMEESADKIVQDARAAIDKSSMSSSEKETQQQALGQELEALTALRVEGDEMVGDCLSGTSRITRIVREMGTFAVEDRAFAGPLRLGDITECAIQQLREEFEGARIAVKGDRELRVHGVSAQLARVVHAITRNALQASPNRRVTLSLAKKAKSQIEIRIEDNGPGIPKDRRDKVFEPFFTTRRVDKDKGLGLGLSVAYAIVASMGGSLTIEDAAAGGACVLIRLPVDPQELGSSERKED